MIKGKISLAVALIIFVTGATIGVLGGALYATVNATRTEADIMMLAIADSTNRMVPVLLTLNDNQLNLFASSAQTQITASVVVMDLNKTLLKPETKHRVESVLANIAHHREKLNLGHYADPPREDIEAILLSYLD